MFTQTFVVIKLTRHSPDSLLFSHSPAGLSDFRAHYVDSYLEPQLMVVCDGPTEDSTVKFWQMVWDEGCTYLIMLTPQDEDVSLPVGVVPCNIM